MSAPMQSASTPANTVEAGDRPVDFSQRGAREVLYGEIGALKAAFHWAISPQGFKFWNAQYDAGHVHDEGRSILETWIAQDKAAGGAK